MELSDLQSAIKAVGVCDQIEAAIQAGDQMVIKFYKQHLKSWANAATEDDLLVWAKSLRARAMEIILEEQCEGKGEE